MCIGSMHILTDTCFHLDCVQIPNAGKCCRSSLSLGIMARKKSQNVSTAGGTIIGLTTFLTHGWLNPDVESQRYWLSTSTALIMWKTAFNASMSKALVCICHFHPALQEQETPDGKTPLQGCGIWRRVFIVHSCESYNFSSGKSEGKWHRRHAGR